MLHLLKLTLNPTSVCIKQYENVDACETERAKSQTPRLGRRISKMQKTMYAYANSVQAHRV